MTTTVAAETVRQPPDLARALAQGLGLAAAPSFAAMALLTALDPGVALLCGGASKLGGMTPMYLLMSLFHLSPWLRRRPRQLCCDDR